MSAGFTGGFAMLMITCTETGDSIRTLRLEGKLLEPWTGELRAACAGPGLPLSRIRLDLSRVSYLDAAGVQLVKGLIEQGVTVTACSGFVAEILDLHRR